MFLFLSRALEINWRISLVRDELLAVVCMTASREVTFHN